MILFYFKINFDELQTTAKKNKRMDNIECPRCKTTKYRNPTLKLMVNICGHALCESCVELLFVKGSAACPQCNIALRRNNFRLQIFEDTSVEKELDIRRKILKDFNKQKSDFDSLLEYNNYLEDVETVIFNLANNIDIDATKRKVEQYKRENKSQIMKNKGKRSKEEEALDDMLESEKFEIESRYQELKEAELEVARTKVKKKEAFIDELSFSNLKSQDIVASYTSEKEQPLLRTVPKKNRTTFSVGNETQHVFMPIGKQGDQNLFQYSCPEFDVMGPKGFSPVTLKNSGFLQHVRAPLESERASGFVSEYACQRALEDAFNGILSFP